VAPLVTTLGSQTAAVAKPPLNNAATAATPLPRNHPIGSNVPSVKPPGITATKSARAAEAPDIYSRVSLIKPQFNRAAGTNQLRIAAAHQLSTFLFLIPIDD